MKYFFFSVIACFFYSACTTPENKLRQKDTLNYSDSLQSLTNAIRAFNKIEKESLDSIKKYKLDSLNERCKSILYVLYARDTLIGNNHNEKVTIGECNIRLVNFSTLDNDSLIGLRYGFFVNDSIPILWKFNPGISENIIRVFEIDLKKRKIVRAIISEAAEMKMNAVEHSYDTIKKGIDFKNYIFKFKGRLHPNFKLS